MTDDGEPDEREIATEYSAGLARWLPLDLSIKRTITDRWKRRAEEFPANVAKYAGVDGFDAISERIEASEVLSEAFVDAGFKATRSPDQEFREALARLVAAGLHDDAVIDEVAYYVSIAVQLDPVHIRLLAAYEAYDRPDVRGNILVSALAPDLDIPVPVASSAAEHLHSMSLLTDRLHGDMVNWTPDPAGAFAITPTGRALLEFCLELETEEPD
jgi:hypothetical protein